MQTLKIQHRKIGKDFPPLVIAELGINHNGSLEIAKQMVDAAKRAGVELIKHQTHIIQDEMSSLAKHVIPGNSDKSIYEIMRSCALSEKDEIALKEYIESQGMIFLSTPFSRAGADRLEKMGVSAYKIGSGEMNNTPLIKHIASFGKPMIVSTGMNDLKSVKKTVAILKESGVSFALLHTTNLYPTPPHLVRLGAMQSLMQAFPDIPIGLSDHTQNNNACKSAIALGACIIERHFTDHKNRTGPDIPCSMDEEEARDLIISAKEIFAMRGGEKEPAKEEQVTMDFAFATCVSIAPIKKGEKFSMQNLWVKRPGIGEIKARDFEEILGKTAICDIPSDTHLTWEMIEGKERERETSMGVGVKKKIVFLTGTRADWGKIKSLIQEVKNSLLFEYKIFACGMHLLESYGNTYLEIFKDGFESVVLGKPYTNAKAMDLALSHTIEHFSTFVQNYKPDMIVVHGDRLEALAGSIVGAFQNIIVSHIEGGEVSGSVDESLRHSISKIAHLHFVAKEEAKTRLLQLGEKENHIFVIGSPDIDTMLSKNLPSLESIKEHYYQIKQLKGEGYGIFLYHSVTTELENLESDISSCLQALKASKIPYIIIYPNNDPGSQTIIKHIHTLQDPEQFAVFPSIKFECFLTLLKHAKFLIGNSSAGIREAPIYGVPAINIGTRQEGRYDKNTPHIFSVPAQKEEILRAIQDVQNLPRFPPKLDFGRGDSAKLFLQILKDKKIWKTKLQKKFIDLS
ncbi:N-acetylneuraminic acid synthetase [Helicobacter mustelae]|nr:N-acetylneuraminic acid synthetase [Helicobacter mustelae]